MDSLSYKHLYLTKFDKTKIVKIAITCRHPLFRRLRTNEDKITAFVSRNKDRSLLFFYQNGEDDDYNQLKKYFLEYLIVFYFICSSTTISTDIAEKRNMRRGDISQ